jgi:hypothetical protein
MFRSFRGISCWIVSIPSWSTRSSASCDRVSRIRQQAFHWGMSPRSSKTLLTWRYRRGLMGHLSRSCHSRCSPNSLSLSRATGRVHSRDTGRHLTGAGGVNPEPRSRHGASCSMALVLFDATTGGIGRAAGVDAVRDTRSAEHHHPNANDIARGELERAATQLIPEIDGSGGERVSVSKSAQVFSRLRRYAPCRTSGRLSSRHTAPSLPSVAATAPTPPRPVEPATPSLVHGWPGGGVADTVVPDPSCVIRPPHRGAWNHSWNEM